MFRSCALWICAACVCASAQESAPVGFVRGDVVKWESTAGRGGLELRTAEGRLFTCGFDPKTYMERDNQRVLPAAISAGDKVEVLADQKFGTTACYARTVHVMDATLPLRRPRRLPDPTEAWAPRGDLTFAGVVVRVNNDTLLLKTRANGEQRLLLRTDTRYFSDGVRVGPAHLAVRTRVFIRAGRNLDGDVEAYQVIWGDIVRPD